MATSSILNFNVPPLDGQKGDNHMRQQQSIFQEEDELSIDLSDAGPIYDDQAVGGLGGQHPTHQNPMDDKSFMSDFPDDFLVSNPRQKHVHNSRQMLGEAAPASGVGGSQAQHDFYAGTKRKRVMTSGSSFGHQKYPITQGSSLVGSTQGSSFPQGSNNYAAPHHMHPQQEHLYEQQVNNFNDILSVNEDAQGNHHLGSFNNPTDSSLDSIAAMKRSKNREAAKRSRARKKADQNGLQNSNDKIVKENNKLKLDNAALRAENQILRRQLNYFENLFAKKTQSHHSYDHGVASSQGTQSHSSASVISGEEITLRRRLGGAGSHQLKTQEIKFSEKTQQAPAPMTANNAEEEGEISFVLERNVSETPTGNRLGLFSLALIMCICCFSSFFGPTVTGGVMPAGAESTVNLSGAYQPQSGSSMSLQEAIPDGAADPTPDQVAHMSSTDQEPIFDGGATSQQAAAIQMTFLQVVLHTVWVNLLKLVFLVAFAFCLLLFPKEEMVQWAARKPFLRRIFDFSEVPMAAQTKFIKSDKLF